MDVGGCVDIPHVHKNMLENQFRCEYVRCMRLHTERYRNYSRRIIYVLVLCQRRCHSGSAGSTRPDSTCFLVAQSQSGYLETLLALSTVVMHSGEEFLLAVIQPSGQQIRVSEAR